MGSIVTNAWDQEASSEEASFCHFVLGGCLRQHHERLFYARVDRFATFGAESFEKALGIIYDGTSIAAPEVNAYNRSK